MDERTRMELEAAAFRGWSRICARAPMCRISI